MGWGWCQDCHFCAIDGGDSEGSLWARVNDMFILSISYPRAERREAGSAEEGTKFFLWKSFSPDALQSNKLRFNLPL